MAKSLSERRVVISNNSHTQRQNRTSQAVIVSHGWPSRPALIEADLAWLGGRVEKTLADWRVRTATLAAPRSLELAISQCPEDAPLHIYPFFMSDGWFVSDFLRRRVKEIRKDNLIWHKPFGLARSLPELCIEAIKSSGMASDVSDMTLITVAHGSPDNLRPAEVARQITGKIAKTMGFAEWRCGFVDEAPYLKDVLQCDTPAICLPLFATMAGHVREDLDLAISTSRFRGTLLPVVGTYPNVPQLIAAELEGPRQS